MTKNKDQMHPEDLRNLIIFGVLSLCIWFLYEVYILKPQKEALDRAKKAKAQIEKNEPELLEPVKFETREDLLSNSKSSRIKFDNKSIAGSILLEGGRIDDLSLSQYFTTLEKKENVTILNPSGTKGSRYIDYGWVSADKKINMPNSRTVWTVQSGGELTQDKPITLVWDNGQGLKFERLITMDKLYLFKISQRVYNYTDHEVELYPFALISQTGVPVDFTGRWVAYEGPMGYIGGELVNKGYDTILKAPKLSKEADSGWIGITEKYWLTALIPPQNQNAKFRFHFTRDPIHPELNRYQTDFTGSAMTIRAGEVGEEVFHIFTGAKKVPVLEEYERSIPVQNIDLAVDFGWFWFFTYPFFMALHYLGQIFGNMGLAIITLTIIIRSCAFPLTNTTFKSFAKMKVVSPQVVELREKYADDKEKLQTEIVALYQKEGVNPLAGCLPMLIQIPIFFALYKIILITIELRQAPFFGWIQDLSARDPTSIFNLFGYFPWTPPHALMIGVWPCIMLIMMLMQKQLTPPPQDAVQRDMRTYFPFVMTYIMSGFAAGLVIYWTFSALISIIQQVIIMKSLGAPVYFFEKEKFKEEKKKALEKGPDVHPMAAMIEQETEKALFGEATEDQVVTLQEEYAGESQENQKKPKKKKKKKKKT